MERLRASWLVDGTGAPVARDVVVELTGQTVAAVRAGERPALGPGWTDLSGHTLIPALVDAHVHLFMSPTADEGARRRQLESSYDELLPTMRQNARALLAAGVLAARDGGDAGGCSLRFRDEELGDSPLCLRSPGRAFRAEGRYGKLIGRPPRAGATLADAIRQDDEPADHVKVAQSGLNSLLRFGRSTRPQFSVAELSAAVRAAGERGLAVMAHANGPAPVAIAAEAGCASVEHGYFMGAEAMDRLAERGCRWVPTAVTMAGFAADLPEGDPRRGVARETLDHQLEQIAAARQRGVIIACGTDAGALGVEHGAALGREMALLVEGGLSIVEAIAAATSVGARLLGVDDRLGTLSPGRPATLLAYRCPPEGLLPGRISRPDALWLRGRPVDLDGPAGT